MNQLSEKELLKLKKKIQSMDESLVKRPAMIYPIIPHLIDEILELRKELKRISPIEQVKELKNNKDKYIGDGFGNFWEKKCPSCGKNSMVIVRPGFVTCGNCG